tara:strand:+ start:6874 stop:7878 length:1005 start_codon:yes stop_codon:yes gene_type:complete
MKILITGGCGFVGSNLAIYLKENKIAKKIDSLDNLSRQGSFLNYKRLKKKNIKNFKADISSSYFLKKLPKYDLIIDCCAEAAVEASKKEIDRVFFTNLVGTFNILKKCKNDKSNIIFLSSSRIYSISSLRKIKNKNFLINENFNTTKPKSIYGFCKKSSEELIKEFSYLYNIKYIINRLGVISGPWQFGKQDQGFVSLWVWNHMNKKKMSYIGFGGKGLQIRDVVHVSDVCKLIAIQVKKIKSINNLTVNVGGGRRNAVSLKNLTRICEKITSHKINISSKKQTSIYDIPYYITDNSMAKKTYGWFPEKSFLHIVRDVYKWMLSYKKTLKKYIK